MSVVGVAPVRRLGALRAERCTELIRAVDAARDALEEAAAKLEATHVRIEAMLVRLAGPTGDEPLAEEHPT